MKIRFLQYLSCMFMAIFITSYIFGSHVQPVRKLVIPYASDEISIDGVDDELNWSELQSMDAFDRTGCPDYPSNDFTSFFKVCYDETNLYVYGVVIDDVDNSYSGQGNHWQFDNIWIFFDLDTNNLGITAYDDQTQSYFINRNVDSVRNGSNARETSSCILLNESNSTGWSFELAIPWTIIMAPGKLPEEIIPYFSLVNGFDIMGTDSDSSDPINGGRDCMTSWDNDDPSDATDRTEDNAWNNRSVFGIVEFAPIIPADPSPYISPVRKMESPVRTELIEIDGEDVEESYGEQQTLSVFNSSGIINSNDLSGYFKTTWDVKYLYFYSQISDNTSNLWSVDDTIEAAFDNLELFIDLDTNHNSSTYDENTHMLRFHRGTDTLTSYGNADWNDFIINNRNTPGDNGWIIEAAIPWTSIMPSGAALKDMENYAKVSFGFDVIVNDSDSDSLGHGAIDGQLGWDIDDPSTSGDLTEESADTNVFAFGIIKLKGTPAPPPTGPVSYCIPVKKAAIPASYGDTIVIDGIKDDHSWSPSSNLSLFNGTGYGGTSDISATLSYCWDYTHLYIFINITDNNELGWNGTGDLRDYDNVEVFIDLDTSNTISTYGESTTRLLFSRGLDSIANPGRALQEDFSIYSQNMTNGPGWILEAAIPWSSALPEGSEQEAIKNYISKTIGFDIHINDCDNVVSNNQNPDKQLAWDLDDPQTISDRTENLASKNRFVFGLVTFYGSPYSGIRTKIVGNSFVLAPNPATNTLTISNLTSESKIEIVTMTGEIILSKQSYSDSEILDIENLGSGIYIVRITIENEIKLLKFIKK